MSLAGQSVVITGASMGIGAATARLLAAQGATLVLLARSEDKLARLAEEIRAATPDARVLHFSVDVRDYAAIAATMTAVVAELGKPIDVLINNAGLALGAPAVFPDQSIADIVTMVETNISGVMYAAHAVLNQGLMRQQQTGVILNVTSVTGLEAPPFPGEAVYHTAKAAQEAFSNSLRIELSGSNIRVAVVRPGVVATNFHEQRVGYDASLISDFVQGYEPLVADDVADAIAWMLAKPERVAIKALDVVPTAQRSLTVFDREWTKRNASSQ